MDCNFKFQHFVVSTLESLSAALKGYSWLMCLSVLETSHPSFPFVWTSKSKVFWHYCLNQKYSRLRCLLLRVKGLVICFYLGWSGSILQFTQNIIKVGSKSLLLTCSSNITLSLPLYTGSASNRELNFCNGYLSLLYFWTNWLRSVFCLFFTSYLSQF